MLTPEQRAEQLIWKFEDKITSDDYPGEAIECALICANELMNLTKDSDEKIYYAKVIEEIKLK